MFFRILLTCCYLPVIISCEISRYSARRNCLSGHMTDRQSWVNGLGALSVARSEYNYSLDLSYTKNPVQVLHQLTDHTTQTYYPIKYISFANSALTEIPPIYQMSIGGGSFLSETVEFMSFYGNNFDDAHAPNTEVEELYSATETAPVNTPISPKSNEADNTWSSSLRQTKFPNLKELDLRACSIKILHSYIFSGMPKLEALYLGENEIFYIHPEVFIGQHNLLHLDLSSNTPTDQDGQLQSLKTDSFLAFEHLDNLESLDLSHSSLSPDHRGMIMGFKKLKSLSICNTGLTDLQPRIFSAMPLEILDISNNHGILAKSNILGDLESTLRILSASGTGLKYIDIFENFSKLEILRLSRNEIVHIPPDVVSTLTNLQILDLSVNRVISWTNRTFSLMPNLRFLSLSENNINVLSPTMIRDLSGVDFIGLSNNFIVCYCDVREFFEMAAANENKLNDTKIKEINPAEHLYHRGYYFYNRIIFDRTPIVFKGKTKIEKTGRFRLIDYDKSDFRCLKVPDGIFISIMNVQNCFTVKRDSNNMSNNLDVGRNVLFVLLIIPFTMIAVMLLPPVRRYLDYLFISMKNSALLRFIKKKKIVDDGTIFNYDVFVSYCNEDRGWVLDHLLPHMEADCSISACLHERDFQVGLSILENIVLCMDRSRFIMLVLSQRFLISRWCQFEMHLAQHRLLETRREDLILVLLEDIPRRVRPNTLHYLMLTKTYIVWPKEESERVLFWKRLKKSLPTDKNKLTQNVSMA
ncbi:unnamed protein product [Arctia plantaginis]|uniref:TIR domain-containing protein n=1 Tax=Arctia plantaginis TaxID=874455 RepID=A0A8S1BEI7_ARCPL|nr:unnamed protein product [Arctia plantaginis]